MFNGYLIYISIFIAPYAGHQISIMATRMSPLKPYLRSLFAFLILAQIATSFVITPRNVSNLDRPSHKGDPSYCADSPDWEYRGDQEEDCLGAIRLLHDNDVRLHGHSEFEFLNDHAQQHLSLAIQRAPRKYIYREWRFPAILEGALMLSGKALARWPLYC